MNWIKSHKILTAIVAVVALIVIAGVAGGNDKKNSTTTATNNAAPATSNTQSTEKPKQQEQPKPTVPTYTLVGEYGQGGRVYVIAPSDATVEKLTLIGKDLNSKYGADSFARLSIFTDRKQAEIMANNPLDAANLEGAAADAYDKSYVGQLNINKSTGLKQFTIMLNGEDKEVSL